ncbi:DUF2357 domain-containing protein [Limibacter armeniacum]|uniref:DUF2357 domain-containing protein n=1 Tax=Limibacter armeniacum TaxID=466084 RepID=UPI002FE65740
MEVRNNIEINLDFIENGLTLTIDAKTKNTLFYVPDAAENGEVEYQLQESFTYDYEFNDNRFSFLKDIVVQPHTRKHHIGTISPNIYVGTLSLFVYSDDKQVGKVLLEVQSLKSSYRSDYRDMLEFITQQCTDLLLQVNSPVTHNFETDFNQDSKSLYQKFTFIRSIMETDEFSESVHKIVSAPVTQWKEITSERDIRNVRRFKNSHIKDLLGGSKRTELSKSHFLRSRYGLKTIPDKLYSSRKVDSVDTPENRFVKFALESFLIFCSEINKRSAKDSRLWKESFLLENKLESFLHHSLFKEISSPHTLKLNSPILQRKEGYREILKVWLMFDLATKLVWHGGEDVYEGGKKDIATLYEYWVFFKLLSLFEEIFQIKKEDISNLIKETNDGLSLQLKQGNHTALKGVYDTGNRKLNVRFNYNKSFSGKKGYPLGGSWTTTMRPDYTLSFWPEGVPEKNAELEELIVHIHFDAKYKIANLPDLLHSSSNDVLEIEKEENRKGIYKNADLLKMHAYKDAIRRTGGAYVLYPGDVSVNRKGFHEVIPGLGAFPVRPSKLNDGIGELKSFILSVINHFENRASQREKIAFRTFDIFKDKPFKGSELHESLPEPYGNNRHLLPDQTYVLVGYYRESNYKWIIEKGLYNIRIDSSRGSLRLGPSEAGANYVLLHTDSESETSKLFKIIEQGPRVFSKQELLKNEYPSTPSQDYYLVYKIQKVIESGLEGKSWDIKKLQEYKDAGESALPFSVTLSRLMKAKID